MNKLLLIFKTYHIAIILMFILPLSQMACGPQIPVSTFDSPFPKKNFDLTKILGNQILIKRFPDTLSIIISANKYQNTLTNRETGDTIFQGKVCKYRGLFYFSEKLKNDEYWIYCVKIEDSLIYGFDSDWIQALYVDSEIKSGHGEKLIKFINSDTSMISLHPEKHEMKKLFNSIINDFSPDTLIDDGIKQDKIVEIKSSLEEIDPEEFNYILKAYPNPTRNIVNVELQNGKQSNYKLIDLNGKIIFEGQLNEITNRIDLSKQRSGIYALTVYNIADKQKETIKIIKSE